jgi:signal transduction histidine kinase/ligand-binding sensor domain-containing protein
MPRTKRFIFFSILLIALLSGAAKPAGAVSGATVQTGWGAVGFGAGVMRFDHLSVTDGLSDDTVLTILQDQQGFLWFGTKEGLNLYNGYDFTVYQADPNDPDSLSDAYITAAVEDPSGDLWLGTYYGGLNRFDRQSGVFERFLPDPNDPRALPIERINTLLMTAAGKLWVGTRAGLSLMDPVEQDFLTYTHNPENTTSISNNEILSLYEDKDGTLWIGTRDGLNQFDPVSGTFTRILEGMLSGASQVNAIIGDGDHGLWVGTSDGLFHLDRRTLTYKVYTHEEADTNSLSSNVVTTLYLDRSGSLWIGFADDGLNLVSEFSPESFRVISYVHQDYDVNSLSTDGIRAIFEDDGGIMWFGTLGGGINKANPETRAFGFYQHKPGNLNSPSSDNITAMAFDEARRSLWIGTADSGLDRMDLVTGKFIHYDARSTSSNSLHSNQVLLLHIGSRGQLYVSTAGGSVQVYDPAISGFVAVLPGYADFPGDAETTAMTHDRDGMLWLSQASGELIRVDPASDKVVRYQLETSEPPYLKDDMILAISVDDEGIIWLGTESQGLVRFDPGENTFVVYSENGTTTGPSHNSITNIYRDGDGALWLGTAGGGLNRFDLKTGQFTYYTIENGLPSNRVFGIARDAYDFLWLSTGNGLARLYPISGLVRTYDIRDGLQGSSFNQNAYAVGNDGALFFGGTNGFNAFYPSEISGNDHIPPAVITSVSLFNQVLETNISDCSATLSLTHDQNFLSFEFAALDYTAPDRNQYAYILEGLNDDYVNAGTRRYADYPNLNWGKYTFRLLASNNDDVWNTSGACLNIVIQPPFWATWWFIGLVGLFLAASVVIGYRWRSRQIEQQRQQLAVQVFERTQEIERRRQMASGLSDVIRLLNTNQPLEMSLDFIVKQTVGLTSASKAVIFERQEDLVVVKACYPEGKTYSINLTDPDSSSAKSLLQSIFLNRLLIYSRVDPQTMRSETHWELVSGDYHTVICTPLLVDEVVYGGLVLYYGEERTFTPDEINLAHTLANQASLAISNERLKGRAEEAAVAAERNRLARDLHDAVTQTLFSTSLIAEVLPKIWDKNPEQAQKRLDELRQLTRGALGEMRTLLMELRPSAFRDADPGELFRHLTDAFSGRTGVPVAFEVNNITNCDLPVEVKNVFYRIAQEGLNNVFKHADATQVWFHFGCYDREVILTISDDGQGFAQEDVPAGHLGLGIMAERAESIGADLTLVSQPDEGTTLRLVWRFEENQLK